MSKVIHLSHKLHKLPTPSKLAALLTHRSGRFSLVMIILAATVSAQAAPTVTATDSATAPLVAEDSNSNTNSQKDGKTAIEATMPVNNNSLSAQRQPSNQALSTANQQLLSHNVQLQRQVNDLQTQVNVLIYESKGQLFLYGAFTVLISLLIGAFISWLVLFLRRERW
ncbi:hypothetical protein [Psychrobacter frigidicola]|uniref:hypothetical protein n=1 Tax=Psychrobacter frigidicola TaxID=45611 RepID=UPI001D11A643|nr:hypothetical protein [Psychrobacter frigidicola]